MQDDPLKTVARLLDEGDARGRKDDATAIAITIVGEAGMDERAKTP